MKNEDTAYKNRIELAIHRQQRKHVLPKKESLNILNNECPYCLEYAECSRTWDFSSNGHMRQICKIRSSELDQTWLELYGKDRPQVSIGDKFGKLLVEAAQGRDNHKNPLWQCLCTCGKIKVVRGSNLLNGHTTSCGCSKGSGLGLQVSFRRISSICSAPSCCRYWLVSRGHDHGYSRKDKF
jgi:hypothetical protein